MLDSEEIDDDYFTPIPNTFLKNVFGSTLRTPEAEDPLKYIPPKAEVNIVNPTGETATANKCIFACALKAYEWSENAYKSKGKVGLAIVKAIETDLHYIILYDSNKTPQSKTSVTPNLNISMKDNVQLSFYDDHRKYWVLAGLETEVSEIRENVQKMGVKINNFQTTDYSNATAPSNDQGNHQYEPTISQFNQSKENTENETDSSENMKNRVSILNRMAGMGQSVLPRQTLLKTNINSESSSSSSTDSDSPSPIPSNSFSNKTVHHQPTSTFKAKHIKKEAPEMVLSKAFQPSDSHATQLFHGQIVPFTNPTTSTTITTVCSNTGELNNFMSEQRISNTEIRININKTTDKVDQILEILKHPSSQIGTNNDFEINIMKKLLNEYEEKIKKYEQEIKGPCLDITDKDLRKLLKNNDLKMNEYQEIIRILSETNVKMQADYENQIVMLKKKIESHGKRNTDEAQSFAINPASTNDQCNPFVEDIDTQTLKKKIKNLEDIITEKDNRSMNLQLQIQEDNKKSLVMLTEKDSYYSTEIERLKEIISENVQQRNTLDIDVLYENKLKKVMNEVFQLISVNFENDERYSGENVKKVVAAIIKKTTNENISNSNSSS